MKFILTLVLCLLLINIGQAQPNLYDSIPIYDKKCQPIWKGGVSIVHTRLKQTFGRSARMVPRLGGGFEYNPTFVKLDHNFDTLWSVMYGGSGEDLIMHMQELPNGNLVMLGHTSSVDGTVTYNPTNSLRMIWVQIVDTNGIVVKAKIFGAYNGGNDYRNSMVAANGDIYVCGGTLGNDNDFAHPNNGNSFNNDGFVMKLNGNLDISWVRFISGDGIDIVESVNAFSDTKILIAGGNNDSTGQVNLGDSTRGLYDAVIKMLDTAGNTIWQKRYGSAGIDVIQKCLYNSSENNIYCVGVSNSFSGDITYKRTLDDTDYTFIPPFYEGINNEWILILDTNGIKAGQGMNFREAFLFKDQLYTLFQSGNGGGDLPINVKPNTFNAFIGKFDSNANLIGKYVINGSSTDNFAGNFIRDNNLYVYGTSNSILSAVNTYSCDTIKDFRFYLQLSNTPLSINDPLINSKNQQLLIVPNPSHSIIKIQLAGFSGYYNIGIYDTQGKEWLQFLNMQGAEQIINIANLPSQTYFVKVANTKGTAANGSFIKD
jgi:Secretion system C-terminal sorting domain